LRRRSMAMLCYLAEHPGRLLTKAELRQLLVRQLEAFPSEGNRVLAAASVVGEQFTMAAVATGAQCLVGDVEARYEPLVGQHQFLEDIGLREWPDGTSSGRYRFAHALYRQMLYEGLGAGAAPAIAPAHWRAAGGRLWRAGTRDRRPARRPLRARGRDPA
jgi:hypothetical protein